MTRRISGLVFSLLASLMILVCLIWLTFPVTVPALISWQLTDSNWQLGDFAIQRPVDSDLQIAQAQLNDSAGNYQLSAINTVLRTNGLNLANLALDVQQLTISISPGQTADPGGTIDLPALLDTYLSSFPLPVQRGSIHLLLLCLPDAECQQGSLEWSSTKPGSQISIQTDDLRADLDLTDQVAKLALTAVQGSALDASLELRWPDRSNLAIKGNVTIAVEQWRKLLGLDLPGGIDGSMDSAAVELDVNLPLAIYDSVLALALGVTGDIQLDTEGNLGWTDQTISIDNPSPLSMAIHLQPEVAQLTTRHGHRIQLGFPAAGSAFITIPTGLTCTLDKASQIGSCRMPEQPVSTTLATQSLRAEIQISKAQAKLMVGNALAAKPTSQDPMATDAESATSTDYQLTGDLVIAGSAAMDSTDQGFKLTFTQPMKLGFELTPDRLQLRTDAGFGFNGSIGSTTSVLVSVPGPANCSLSLVNSTSHCAISKLSLQASLPDNQSVATVDLVNTELSASTASDLKLTTSLALNLTEAGNERARMIGILNLAGADVHLTSRDLTLDQLLFKQLNAHHNLTTQAGALALEYKSQAVVLEQWTGFPVHGQVTLSQNMEWQGPFDTDWQDWQVKTLTTVVASGLNTEIDGSIFTGGHLDASFSGWPTLHTTTPARLTWKSIDVGFPVENALMDFSMEIEPLSEAFQIKGVFAQAELLGGKVTSNSFSYDYPADQGLFLAKLELLELKQVLTLIEGDLQSSGKLVGHIPLSYDKGHISVTAGHVKSIAPGGFIQYQVNQPTTSLASGNPQMALVMKMLRDFRYDILKSDVDYSNRSILTLKTTLSGRNPEVENGRQINFNLNIEEDIAALLESLRLSREVSDSVDKSFTGPKKHGTKTDSSKPREPHDG